MSRSTKKFWKQSLMALAWGTGGVLGLIYVQAFAKLDPLSKLRPNRLEARGEQGIRLGDVHFIQYNGPRKVSEAHVEHVFITDDRRQYRMSGVQRGTYYAENGKRKMSFSAPNALWNTTYSVLTANNGIRVWNADMDLKAASFRIDNQAQTMYVPGRISGKLMDGKVQTINLLYNIDTRVATAGPTTWDGNLALNLQDEKTQPRKWKFSNEKSSYESDGDIQTWQKAKAEDGEVIIKADLIEYNRKTDIVTATGNVRYFSPGSNLSCQKVVAYRKERRAVFTGAVDMLIKPKDQQTKAVETEIPPFRPVVPESVSAGRPAAPPVDAKQDKELQDPKSLRDYPIAITASKIEYWYRKGSRRAVITGNPQARQELTGGRWRHMWGYQGLYDGEAETLKMDSRTGKADVLLKTSSGDNAVAEELMVWTKEGTDKIKVSGITGSFYGTADDEDETGPGIKPPDPIKPGKGGTGGGGLQGPIGGGKKPPARRV